jgi:hypothetical protein
VAAELDQGSGATRAHGLFARGSEVRQPRRQIGTFTRNHDGTFAGFIKTLSLNIKVRFVPTEKDSEKSPDLRALAGSIEIGAGWRRSAKETGQFRSGPFVFILCCIRSRPTRP